MDTLVLFILYGLFFAFLTALMADFKGYSVRQWFWLGFLLGFIATGILFFQPNIKQETDET
ncbi:MAG: hypothetical protein HN927_07730 [Candidatus Marinimicrobia bacterium]|nr:hypothetical protein [Candidatus Neomarinimicrobiota bacterium]MBT3946772.1 hypothetical protein [Candidatus Neomarinimicrobiota bacterium]MBT4064418.1 hypothetical protein [Candidatus Neomarinimicrobiota bacterium]MBT4307387.1 hypothetical protein [Candidatus Neomarinimicrobiota bacterium]MBT4737019.1 hypothetical protein [Candidatus Neomarinimicrobiota bacterium]